MPVAKADGVTEWNRLNEAVYWQCGMWAEVSPTGTPYTLTSCRQYIYPLLTSTRVVRLCYIACQAKVIRSACQRCSQLWQRLLYIHARREHEFTLPERSVSVLPTVNISDSVCELHKMTVYAPTS